MYKLSASLLLFFLSEMAQSATVRGVYDYNQTFTTQTNMAYEEIFVDWNSYTPGTIQSQLSTIYARNRWPILTLQPYHLSSIGTASSLVSDVAAGKYNGIIAAVCSEIRAYNGPMVLRWGHEMEINIGRYDWSTTNYTSYIAAYQEAITTFKSYLSGLPNIYYMWSPAGNSNCNNYYPGDAYVDFCGCSLYSWAAYDKRVGIRNNSFSSLFSPKYALLKIHNKLVFVAEGGVEVQDPQAAWVQAAVAAFPSFPLLTAFVYFNAPDSVAWWSGGPIPNWSISTSIW